MKGTFLGVTVALAVASVMFVRVPRLSGAQEFSEWSAAVNLGPTINSVDNDNGPALSKNGLSLYFASDRPDGEGNLDIWVSRRASLNDPWEPPVNLGPVVNTSGVDHDPALSRDGHWLFTAGDRQGGFGAFDIWAAWRAHTRDDFGWQTPINLGAPVNTAGQEAGPEYFENDDIGVPLLFLTRPRAPGPADIFVSQLQPDGSFGPPAPVTELNSPSGDAKAALRHDGLEVIFQSMRPGSLVGCQPAPCFDLWTATREHASASWSNPVNLGPTVNTSAAEMDAAISANDEMLIFSSNRPGGFGGFDLYVTTRLKLHER